LYLGRKNDMNLKNYYNKKVHIVDSSGKEWEGLVDTYFHPEENDSGNESIIVKTETISVEFEQSDIAEIKEAK